MSWLYPGTWRSVTRGIEISGMTDSLPLVGGLPTLDGIVAKRDTP